MYSERIMNLFANPNNVGILQSASGIVVYTDENTNEIFKLYLKIENNYVVNASFKAYTGVAGIAIMSVFTDMIKNKSGVWGEIHTARYLRDNGYKIISSDFSSRYGEIDIIAMKNGILSFVEVKARDENTPIRPMEAVDAGKQERLEHAAQSFLSYTKLDCETRFDVCEVYLDKDRKPVKINYIENAF